MRIDNAAVALQDELIVLDKASQGRAEARNEYRGSLMMAENKPSIEVFNHIRELLQKKSRQRKSALQQGDYLDAVRHQSYIKTTVDIISNKGSQSLRDFLRRDCEELPSLPYDLELYLYKNNLDDIKDLISTEVKYKTRLEFE